MNLETCSFVFGLSIYVVVIASSFYFLRLGRILSNQKLFKYGSVLLFSSVIIPPLLLATQIEFLIDGFIVLVNDYPILHLFFWMACSIFFIPLFVEFLKDMPEFHDLGETSVKVICVIMGLTASTFGYLFFVFLISTTSAVIASLLLSLFVVLIVFEAALKSS